MTINRIYIQLAALLFSLAFSNVVIAEEKNKNENKNYGAVNTISDVDLIDDAGSNHKFTVEKQANKSDNQEQNSNSSEYSFQTMERDRQRQQLEVYKQYLKKRTQRMNVDPGLPADVQTRRNEYIKHMEQRRELFHKMNEQHRKSVEERRGKMRQLMHRTSTCSPTAIIA